MKKIIKNSFSSCLYSKQINKYILSIIQICFWKYSSLDKQYDSRGGFGIEDVYVLGALLGGQGVGEYTRIKWGVQLLVQLVPYFGGNLFKMAFKGERIFDIRPHYFPKYIHTRLSKLNTRPEYNVDIKSREGQKMEEQLVL